jgi:peroxiredoxin
MLSTLCLFSSVLALAQPPGALDSLVGLRPARGQEFVYAGTFTEEADDGGVHFARTYRLESRLFILEPQTRGTDVALYTVLRQRRTQPGPGGDAEPCSVRLELAFLDSRGRLTPTSAHSLAVALDGPPTLESGALVELPRRRLAPGVSWDLPEEGRPPHAWQVTAAEVVNGVSCLKLTGTQESDDWGTPRADRTAWRRRDTVWLIPGLGLGARVERVIERREPARREATRRSIARYDLESRLVYPGQLFEDRRREILQFRRLAEAADPCLRGAEKDGPGVCAALEGRIAAHVDNQPATPYREALFQLRRRLDTARRGESTAGEGLDAAAPVAPVAALGQLAPDFVATNLLTRESARLRHWLGRPVLLVFYNPTSRSAGEVLRFTRALSNRRADVHVVGLAVTDDPEQVLKQAKEFQVPFPILAGQGLRLTYGVDGTPKFIVLDAAGIVRGAFVGWGRETPDLISEELARETPVPRTDGREPGNR